LQIDEISIGLWIIFGVFSLFFGIMLTRKALDPESGRPQREYYLGIAIFILIHILARVFYFMYDFIERNETYWNLGALIGIGCVIFLLYAIERNIFTRTKFIITIITIINLILLTIFTLVESLETAKIVVQFINTGLVGLFIPLIYLYVAYKSSGIYRKHSLLIALGIIIFLIGQTAHSKALLIEGNAIYFILSPSLMLIGGIVFLYGLIRTT